MRGNRDGPSPGLSSKDPKGRGDFASGNFEAEPLRVPLPERLCMGRLGSLCHPRSAKTPPAASIFPEPPPLQASRPLFDAAIGTGGALRQRNSAPRFRFDLAAAIRSLGSPGQKLLHHNSWIQLHCEDPLIAKEFP